MSRLTKKYDDNSGYTTIESTEGCGCGYDDINIYPYNDCVDKLGKLEDLEEELNFDLEIVIKSLLNGVYCTHSTSERNYFSGTELSISGNHKALVVYENNVCWITKNGERIKQQRVVYKRFEFKDYGKTWWLEKPKGNSND